MLLQKPGCFSKRLCSALTLAGKKSRRIGLPPLARSRLPQIDRGGLALIAAFELEAHPLAFVQVTHASAFDSRDVHEHIFRPVLRLNKAVALLGIEPFHGSDRHFCPSQIEIRHRSRANSAV